MRSTAALLAVLFLGACATGTWTELGPKWAGRVSAIAATDVNHLWVATPGGGVWRSTDGGTTFSWAGNYGLGDFTAVNLAIDRNDSSRMYLRTWSGVLVSTDGAAHWTRTLYSLPQGDTPYPYPSRMCSSWPVCPPFASMATEPGPFTQMVFSPSQSVLLTSLPCQGLQYSTDSGAHFTHLWPFSALSGSPQQRNPGNCINAIAADESTHQVWIATSEVGPARIYRSSLPWTAAGPPAGMTWEPVATGLPLTGYAINLVWGGSANRMMAILHISNTYTAYLYTGGSWSAKPWNNAQCVFFDARSLAWGGGNDFFAGGVTFAYTNDAGDHWTCPSLGQQYVDIRAVYPKASANSVWIGGDQNQFGNYRLLTRYTWSPGSTLSSPVGITATGIHSWQTYSIAQGAGMNRILVGAQDISTACSDDLGTNFTLTSNEEIAGIAWPAGGGGNRVYLYGTKGTLHKATNAASAANCAAVTFTDVSSPDMFHGTQALTGPHTVAVQPNAIDRVFTVSRGQVVYSTDAAVTWHGSQLGLTVSAGTPVGLTAVMVDEDGVVYVGTQDHGVYTCSDTTHYCDGSVGAGTWTPFALNPGGAVTPPAYITAITQSNAPPAPRNFWIATSQGVYRRLAGSSTWTAVDAINLYPYSDVVVDPNCRTRIYTAMGYLGDVTRTRGGVHVSTDNGASWNSLTSGFPLHNSPITQVLVDSAHPERVFASTYGRGAWLWVWPSVPACAP